MKEREREKERGREGRREGEREKKKERAYIRKESIHGLVKYIRNT